jgi:hypothetical protein
MKYLTSPPEGYLFDYDFIGIYFSVTLKLFTGKIELKSSPALFSLVTDQKPVKDNLHF